MIAAATMKLSTRLLLPLVGAVTVVMSIFAFWAQLQRESSLVAEARRETEAYATALGLALEEAFRDPDRAQVQQVIDRLSQERTIYAILVYDLDGTVPFTSASLQRTDAAPVHIVEGVLRTARPVSFERFIDDQEVFSVLRVFQGSGGEVAGAFEVTQPLAFVQAELARTRQRFFLNTLALLAAVAGLTWWLVGRLVSRPLDRFSQAVQALGRGDLTYRVDDTGSAQELREVATHLNQMADHLQKARTELMAESEERVALERRVRASEKMAIVGDLAARVGHEIAAPLQVIRGRADMILRSDNGPEDRARQLRIIVQQIDRITFIVRNLLGFARRPEPKKVPVDVTEVVGSVAEFLEGEMSRARIRLHLSTPHPELVLADHDLLFQVFTNLVMNAIQALENREDPRELWISTDRIPGDRESPGAWITVRVEDSGPGVPEESMPMVFEPFFTTKSGAAGTGLGLAVAQTAVVEMGGTIHVENRGAWEGGDPKPGSGGTGARFMVKLPSANTGGPEDA
jgi:signal transduction histidine kinase